MQEGDSREKVNFEEEKTRQKFHKTLFPQILEAKIEDQGGPLDFLLRQELFTLARVTTGIYICMKAAMPCGNKKASKQKMHM